MSGAPFLRPSLKTQHFHVCGIIFERLTHNLKTIRGKLFKTLKKTVDRLLYKRSTPWQPRKAKRSVFGLEPAVCSGGRPLRYQVESMGFIDEVLDVDTMPKSSSSEV